MVNTIRYRQWLPDGKYHYWGWIEEGMFVSPITNIYTSQTEAIKASEQFTGMLDRKGREIWAGDIVKYKVGNLWVNGEVYYDPEWAVWFKGNNQNLSSYRKTTEVIDHKYSEQWNA